ncbi:hypothetical protein QUF79_14530 [Fictibacillus enclensis]|uniref:hypothetical protein n=1 Tax=Fictibacillus enclensis TaxID=1017270 RepID=UPI0025A2F6DB|nr:hypothetical protein [Fictibacillus enclensis]MDM5199234.1 hypothetical protein [Fictibacillus enclensis]
MYISNKKVHRVFSTRVAEFLESKGHERLEDKVAFNDKGKPFSLFPYNKVLQKHLDEYTKLKAQEKLI